MTTPALSDSRLAATGARTIRDVYHEFDGRFRIITRRAPIRFVGRDWKGMTADAGERLDLYPKMANEAAHHVRRTLQDRTEDRQIWASMKAVYSSLIQEREDWELAETFFNSVTRRIFAQSGVDPGIEFVDTDFDTPPHEAAKAVYRDYADLPIPDLLRHIMLDAGFERFRSLEDDCRLAATRIEAHLRRSRALRVVDRAEVSEAVFYRGKAAYLVGRLYSGSQVFPLALALLHPPEGITLDAVLLTENQLSVLFSFTRSYFHVDARRPYDLVRFLHSLMPHKRLAEIYIAIGHNKHGKTTLYRELRQHLASTGERFVIARGARGLVMVVFTLPGFDVVFKVIKDHFPAPKRTSRSDVRARYRLVFRHDRAGRLVDAQEFEHLRFSAERFAPDLVELLQAECGRSVTQHGGDLIIAHAYVERRVIPLDIYLRDSDQGAAREATIDYGQAIKDLAASGIFPGDLLIKNFGVTRNRRVVFYDYDELTTLDRCVFRELPAPTTPDEEMAADPWFAIGPDDVFPEEFASFLGVDGWLREAFLEHHADLLDPTTWRRIQAQVRAGELIEIFPYIQDARLRS
jgi:isocitrate dehydrogenase kinase/phosphatase